ncbi:MAG: caspase family protein [Winogradskyella sp.]|uniref:caspase family protein n=1 Tax=Winogradskyella sp. TaxID=1883156 RepID=UPI0025D65989|nr:caspase family protein [Winogradskyella sp.]NRB61100.1 caspase family protein [Winogradskyella sp.]
MRLKIFFIVFLTSICSHAQELKLGYNQGHNNSILSSKFSPNGKLILSTSLDNTIKIWDYNTKKLIHTFKGHSGNIYQSLFSPKGDFYITVSHDSTTKVWDLNNLKLKLDIKTNKSKISTVNISNNGELLITGSDKGKVEIYSLISGQKINEKKAHKTTINSISVNPDGESFATGSAAGKLIIWNITNLSVKNQIEAHEDEINLVNYDNNGNKIITASFDNSLKLWDAKGGLLKIFNGHEDWVWSADFSPDSKQIVSGSWDNGIRIWDTNSGQLIYNLEYHEDTIVSTEFSPDGSKILSLSSDGQVFLWNAKSGTMISNLNTKSQNLINVSYNYNGENIVGTSSDGRIIIWDSKNLEIIKVFNQYSARIYNSNFFENGEQIEINAKMDYFLDSYSGKPISLKKEISDSPTRYHCGKYTYYYKDYYQRQLNDIDGLECKLAENIALKDYADYNKDFSQIATISYDNSALIWNVKNGKVISSLKHDSEVIGAKFNWKGDKLITTTIDGFIHIWDLSNGKVIKKIENKLTSPIEESTYYKAEYYAFLSIKEKFLITYYDDYKTIRNTSNYEKIITINRSWDLKFSANEDKLIVYSHWPKDIWIYEAKTGQKIDSLELPKKTYEVGFNDKYLLEPSENTFKITDLKTKKELLKYITINNDPKYWIHLHPSGLFDASPEAMDMMYWTKGLEIIEFSQLKDKYYVPGLWEKVMKGEYLGNADIKKDGIALYPEVKLGEIVKSKLPIQLTKREGGYGEISVFLNGKEIIKDARSANFNSSLPKQTLYIDISQFEDKTINGANNFEVKVKNQKGDAVSRGAVATEVKTKEVKPPSFYALLVGVSDYVGNEIDLKYPVIDADAVESALQLATKNLFKNVEIVKLATNVDQRPRKETIENAITEIAKKANPEDVFMVYMSGHGVNWTDSDNNSDFYFLTEDARFANKEAYNDEMTRKNTTISTNEWVELIKKIPANKTVMVIDACGSGQAVENLVTQRDIDSDQIKAIDRMKDRTGMFVISGSAADQASYEASRYGQGLLTYTLLKGMSGVALKENTKVDVSTLFNYAKDEVPNLARDIGGIQEPLVLFPKSGSFDIGILNSEDQSKIVVNEPKEVYVRSTLMNAEELEDNLELSLLLDKELGTLSTRGKDIIWVDANKYASGCKITGSYTQDGDIITLNYKVKCKDTSEKYQVSAQTKEELIKKVILNL